MLDRPCPDPRLEQRLRRLERRLRRMRWGYALLAAILLGSCAKKPVLPDAITAREFKVVDEEGNVYASLAVAPWNPEGVLVLSDRTNEKRRSSLGPTELVLEDGAASVQLEAGDVSLLVMHDDGGWTGAKLSAHRDRRESALWLSGGRESIFRGPEPPPG